MKKYILSWEDYEAWSYDIHVDQPFITNDIEKWEFELLKHIDNCKKNKKLTFYKNLDLPVCNENFQYEIFTLEEWFNKNLK